MITQHEYETFQRAFDFLNGRLFESKLPPVLITMSRKRRVGGFFRSNSFQARGEEGCTTHEISLNPDGFDGRTDTEIWAVLAHEMAHLWQHEYGKPPPKGNYHNHEWSAKMREIGLMPSSTGDEHGQIVGHKMSHWIPERGLFVDVAAEMLALGIRPSWQSPRQPEPDSAATRESKHKFSCPDCDMKAWAKATASFRCGACDKEMTMEPVQ